MKILLNIILIITFLSINNSFAEDLTDIQITAPSESNSSINNEAINDKKANCTKKTKLLS